MPRDACGSIKRARVIRSTRALRVGPSGVACLGARTAIEGGILKSCGVRAGTPDLILVRDGKTFALELKATGGGHSSAQREAHDELRRAGAEVATAVGIDDAIGQLERWLLLRGSVQ